MSDYSIYPESIDGYAQLPVAVDGITEINAFSVNTLRSAIYNIELELGLNPSIDYKDVATLLLDLKNLTNQNTTDIAEIIEGGLGGGTSNSISFLNFILNGKIPSIVGIRYLAVGTVLSSSSPLVFSKDIRIVSSTYSLSEVDTQEYQVVILGDNIVVGTASIFPGSIRSTSTHDITLKAGSSLAIYIIRVTGSAKSIFSEATINLEIESV